MPKPIAEILAEGESGRVVVVNGKHDWSTPRRVVFRHSVYTRVNDVVVWASHRISKKVNGPTHYLTSSSLTRRAQALQDLIAWKAPSTLTSVCGRVGMRMLYELSSRLCAAHHRAARRVKK